MIQSKSINHLFQIIDIICTSDLTKLADNSEYILAFNLISSLDKSK